MRNLDDLHRLLTARPVSFPYDLLVLREAEKLTLGITPREAGGE